MVGVLCGSIMSLVTATLRRAVRKYARVERRELHDVRRPTVAEVGEGRQSCHGASGST